MLEQRIDAVPAGGSIDWITYYFRDRRLAEALVRALRRGVSVRLCVEKHPRYRAANARIIRLLADPVAGLGEGFVAVHHRLPMHLHTKLYAFSHPQPHALVGSFQPSGDDPPEPAVTARIGDQDSGHNMLVELADPILVSALVAEVAELHRRRGWRTNAAEAPIRSGNTDILFFPFSGPNPLVARLRELRGEGSLRIAASHVGDPVILGQLAKVAERGIEVTLLTGETSRRSPRYVDGYLERHGARVHRWKDPEGLPMHSKFMLADGPGQSWASFGSYNLTLSSRWLNHELLIFSSDAEIWSALDQRWSEMLNSAYR